MKLSTDNTRSIYLTETNRDELFKIIYEKEKEGEDIDWCFYADFIEQFASGKTEQSDYAYKGLSNQLKREYSEWKAENECNTSFCNNGSKYYVLKYTENIERKLPIVKKGNIELAGFDSVGDTELINIASSKLGHRIQLLFEGKIDYIITTEVKGIPIAQGVCTYLNNIPYICLRKESKIYMGKTIEFKGESITSGKSSYFISEDNAEKLKGKNVVFVDDVYSTGSTMNLIEEICKKLGCNLICGAFILKEEEANSFEKGLKTNYARITQFEHNKTICFSTKTLPIIIHK